MFSRLFAVALLFSLLTGCANVQPVLSSEATADASAGYLAGQFSRTKSANSAFVIQSADLEQKYMMALGHDSSWPTALKRQTVAIKLPPGRYVVTSWVTYATVTKEIITRTSLVDDSAFTRPFEIKAGRVTHLGAYDLTHKIGWGALSFQIEALPLGQASVQRDFALAYPGLANQPFRCVGCYDTAPER